MSEDAVTVVRGQLRETTRLGSTILWQDAPVGEVGVTGDQPETLLPVIAERLRTISAGYADSYTEAAVKMVEGAASALELRRMERSQRGVEGTREA